LPEILSISGKELEAPTEGINIVVTEYEGGRAEVKKMMIFQ
jgi:hypothetical protein